MSCIIFSARLTYVSQLDTEDDAESAVSPLSCNAAKFFVQLSTDWLPYDSTKNLAVMLCREKKLTFAAAKLSPIFIMIV